MGKFLFWLLIGFLPVATMATHPDSTRAANWVDQIKPMLNKDAVQARGYLDSLNALLQQHPEWVGLRGQYWKLYGIFYFRLSENDSAKKAYQTAIQTFQSVSDEFELAKTQLNLSMIFNRQGEWDSTLHYAHQSLALFEEQGDKKGIGICTNIIGQVFVSNQDYPKALVYFRRYLKNAIAVGDSIEMGGGYNNIGTTFYYLNQYDSAIYYSQLALAISLQTENAYAEGNALQNLATNFEKLGRMEDAIDYYIRARKIYQSLHYQAGLIETGVNLGGLLKRKNQPAEAIPILVEALALAKETAEVRLQTDILAQLKQCYAQTGDYANAYTTSLTEQTLRDSLFNAETRKTIEDLTAKYETAKKDQAIAALNEENVLKEARNQRNGFLIVVLVLLSASIFSALLLVRARAKAKQSALVLQQERSLRETHIRAMVEGQEKERQRYATDLHDTIGQLLAALQLNLRQLRQEPLQEPLQQSEQLLTDLHGEIRRTIANLMPPVLAREGLEAALRDLALRTTRNSPLQVHFDAWEVPTTLSSDLQIALFRVVQEWTTNVLKYAKAQNIYLSLNAEGNRLTLMMEDDGPGFDATVLTQGKGFGWQNIQTRLDLVGGQLELNTRLGHPGTTLMIAVMLS